MSGHFLTFKYSEVFPRAGKLDLPTSPRLGSRTKVRPRVESPDLTTSTARHVRLGYLLSGAAGAAHSARLDPV